MKLDEANIGSIVKPASEKDAMILSLGFYDGVTINTKFEIDVIIEKGITYRGPESGFIIHKIDEKMKSYPYVWNPTRFIKA